MVKKDPHQAEMKELLVDREKLGRLPDPLREFIRMIPTEGLKYLKAAFCPHFHFSPNPTHHLTVFEIENVPPNPNLIIESKFARLPYRRKTVLNKCNREELGLIKEVFCEDYTHTPFPFLTLPAELREQVYTNAIPNAHHRIFIPASIRYPWPPVQPLALPPLFFTNHQLYNESRRIYYKNAVLLTSIDEATGELDPKFLAAIAKFPHRKISDMLDIWRSGHLQQKLVAMKAQLTTELPNIILWNNLARGVGEVHLPGIDKKFVSDRLRTVVGEGDDDDVVLFRRRIHRQMRWGWVRVTPQAKGEGQKQKPAAVSYKEVYTKPTESELEGLSPETMELFNKF
ncbi:hypothetical protein EJ08DRAFT_733400 [Tothia fuscella]|uniref:Uncharacterized protein n=1 Tax=Tothia fuscella TaxID=1048955 RepID=A0A9P4TZ97_9PEZI|nr:hypothetical protein EJ08DRAFT_733400 [Tothia fuscella]